MDKIDELLSRGVEKIYPSREELEKVLRTGRKLRVYQGFDPTAPNLHIGHLIGLRKLRQWQDLGHEVIFLIGDFTGMIGDPSGKDKTRLPLTREQVLTNAQTYQEQAGSILRFSGENPVQIKFNSQWLDKLSIEDFLRLTSNLTYQQVIKREMFQKRLEKQMDISLNEFLYPVLQGYDSVAMDIDVEIGGNDQLFNMMTGRDLKHKLKRGEKFVMTTPLLTDASGKKIGKTQGNIIALTTPPNQFYGLIMSLGDEIIIKGFTYLTDLPLDEIGKSEAALQNGENPMVYKKKLAYTLTQMLNGEEEAKKAQEEFTSVHQRGETPMHNILTYFTEKPEENIVDILMNSKLAASRSEAKRLVEQGGVEVENKKLQASSFNVQLKSGMTIRVGKTHFVRVEVK